MGGNIVGLYAGARPERIRKLINLEGAGLRRQAGTDAGPLRQVAGQPAGAAGHAHYPTQAAVAARLQKTNPRLSDDKAAFLAQHWSAQNDAGVGNPRRSGPQAGRPAALPRR
jgi:pimeloyl-ACP methyl ester carboxylesterase